jgi:transcription factor TFIIIB component B''
MADLVKDMHIGKKFSLHDELMERERARRMRYGGRKRRQQQDGDDANNEDAQPTTGSTPSSATPAATATEAAASNTDTPGSPPARAGPPLSERYQLINGEIVLDPSSLIVDRHARAREEAATMQEVEENDFTYRVTSSTYLRRNLKPQQWTDEETERFYQALAAFGTDFDTICRMFRGKTRKHIKLKFNREERVNPARINAALVGQKTVAMDLDEYQAHTGNQYETAEAIYAEQKRAQDEFEARQKALDDEKADEARRKKEEAMKQLEVSLAKERGDAGTKRRGRKSKKDQEA